MHLLIIAFLLAQPTTTLAPPPAPGPAGVMVIEDGGLDAATVRTIRGLTATTLRRRGVAVVDDKRFEAVKLPDQSTAQALREAGASKLYALQMGRLGQKLILTLQELSDKLDPVYSASVSLAAVEETDRVLPRLADAVIDRHPPVETASAGAVGQAEPPRRRRGATVAMVGLTFGFLGSDGKSYQHPFGINGALGFEAGEWRLDLLGLVESHGSGSTGFLGIGGSWLPLEGEITPYLSAALGYSALGGSSGSATGDASASGAGLLVGGGVEFLRLHNFRAMAGLDLLVPLYSISSIHAAAPIAPLFSLKIGFQ